MNKITLKDRKLLYWLDQDSRATNKKLGKRVGLTEQAIGYKIKKLKKVKVIKKFVTFVNTLSLGYSHYKVFVKLHNISETKEKQLIQDLIKNENVRWVGSTSGKYDLSFSILAKTPLKLTQMYEKIENKWGKYIIEKNILIAVDAPGFTRDFFINKKESKKVEYTSNITVQKLDEVDTKILKNISQNARKNIVDIAKEINSTVDVVKYRMKKMRENKIINGYTIQLDLQKLHLEYYSISVYTHNLQNETYKKILTFAQFHPCILFVVRTLGNHDLQLEFEVSNYEELEHNLREFRKEFSGNMRNFEIVRVTKEYKYNFFPF